MRWITGITIDNYRAFPKPYEKIVIPPNHHLLIYGENGSGKSSLYNALKDFLESSSNLAKQFDTNLFSRIGGDATGAVTLEIAELDNLGAVTNLNEYRFSNDPAIPTSTNQQFLQVSNKIKGFLDYKRLLKSYLIETPRGKNPNIFSVLIDEILSERQIARGIAQLQLGEEWGRIITDLKTDNRYIKHRNAKKDLVFFEAELKRLLEVVFTEHKRLTTKYFDPQLDINVITSPLTWNWNKANVDAEVGLDIKYAGQSIPSYQTFLNEARLSALAISLYLASIKTYPYTATDLRIIYLDDVFIGLDMGNRIPLLELIQNEFINEGFQIFISTYDRHWYELAQRHFEGQMPNKWKYYELYKSKEIIGGAKIDKPLVIQSENNYTKAVYYLHHETRPDYPAAANYFRKYAEELLQNHIPPHEFKDIEDYATVKTHKLGKYVERTLHFLDNTGTGKALVLELEQSLPTLMHPLSHYDLSAQVYKNELLDLQELLEELHKYLDVLNRGFRLLIPEGRDLRVTYSPNPNLSGIYEIRLMESIYLTNGGRGVTALSKARCRTTTCYDINNGQKENEFNPPVANDNFQYDSLSDAYTKIYNHVITHPDYAGLIRSRDYTNEFEFAQDGNWARLNTFMVW